MNQNLSNEVFLPTAHRHPEAQIGSRRMFMKAAVPAIALAGTAVCASGVEPEGNGELIRRLVGVFEKKDTDRMKPFFHPDVAFENYGFPKVKGLTGLLALWGKVFQQFETVKFETVHQAASGNFVLAEQVHYLGLKGKKAAPIMNMAIYEIQEGKIVAWRDYSDATYNRKLLEG